MDCEGELLSIDELWVSPGANQGALKHSPERTGCGCASFMGFDPSTMVFETSYSKSAVRFSASLREGPGFVGELDWVRTGDPVCGI